MNRRDLIQRFAAIAAVAVAPDCYHQRLGMVPAVRAEEAPSEVLPTLMPGQRWTIETPAIDASWVPAVHTPFIDVDGMRISAVDGSDMRVDPVPNVLRTDVWRIDAWRRSLHA